MQRRTTRFTVAALVLMTVASPALADTPLIATAIVSADGTRVVITGQDFTLPPANPEDSPTPPTVSLALTALPVTASGATSATATLPSSLDAGTYLLVLTRSDNAMAVFYLPIGALGPPGSKGPDGLVGADGSTGLQGLAGPAGPAGPEGPAPRTTDAQWNTVAGLEALHALTTGSYNTVAGRNALRNSTVASSNVAAGASTLRTTVLGTQNTALGFEALVNGTASGNIAVGDGAGRNAVAGANNIYIGHPGVANEQGRIRIGVPNVHTQTHLSGAVFAPSFAGDGSGLTNVPVVYQSDGGSETP